MNYRLEVNGLKLTEQAKAFFAKVGNFFKTLAPQAAGFVKKLVRQTAGFVKAHLVPVCCCAFALVAAIVLIAVLTKGNNNNEDIDTHVAVDAPETTIECTAAPMGDPTPEPTPQPTIRPTRKAFHLYNGVTDIDVIDVQLRLMELNYMDYDEPTDLYGRYTTEAVMLFQRRNSLDITGQMYQRDYDLLMSDEAKPYMASLGDDGTDVKEIQTRLYELDYIDTVTGHFGDTTEAAVKTFQEKNHLTVDGKVGPLTKEALYSEDAVPFSLYLGSEGDDVKNYQDRLHTLGYLTTEPDGKYGQDTVNAVKQFQELNGLISDGYLGPSTKELLTSGNAKANKIENGMSGDTVMKIQKRLYALNYLRSSCVTGYFGSTTEAAVKKFQQNNKITVDGKVGRETMNKLFSDDAKRASSPVSSSGGSSSGNHGGSGSGSGSTYPGTAEGFIAAAMSKLGCPYVRGAKGPNAFDCSGFVYWCLNHAGVQQSYMTSYMWRTTTRYMRINSMSSIKRGDVIVYKMGATSGHVAIALGGGQMIDASSRNGRVVIRSYNTTYWHNTFYCAYRIFGG